MMVLSLWRGLVEQRLQPIQEFALAWCERGYISLSDLRGPATDREIAWPRQDFMASAMGRGYSSTRVGQFLNRDHSTVVVGRKASNARRGL